MEMSRFPEKYFDRPILSPIIFLLLLHIIVKLILLDEVRSSQGQK